MKDYPNIFTRPFLLFLLQNSIFNSMQHFALFLCICEIYQQFSSENQIIIFFFSVHKLLLFLSVHHVWLTQGMDTVCMIHFNEIMSVHLMQTKDFSHRITYTKDTMQPLLEEIDVYMVGLKQFSKCKVRWYSVMSPNDILEHKCCEGNRKLILQCSRPKLDAQKGHCGIVVMPTEFKFFYILDQGVWRSNGNIYETQAI